MERKVTVLALCPQTATSKTITCLILLITRLTLRLPKEARTEALFISEVSRPRMEATTHLSSFLKNRLTLVTWIRKSYLVHMRRPSSLGSNLLSLSPRLPKRPSLNEEMILPLLVIQPSLQVSQETISNPRIMILCPPSQSLDVLFSCQTKDLTNQTGITLLATIRSKETLRILSSSPLLMEISMTRSLSPRE